MQLIKGTRDLLLSGGSNFSAKECLLTGLRCFVPRQYKHLVAVDEGAAALVGA